MTFLSEVVLGIAATSSLYAVLILLGFPIYAVIHRWRPMGLVSIGACSVIGLAWLSTLSWYTFVLGLKLAFAYRMIIGVTVLALALNTVGLFSKPRNSACRLKACLRAMAPDAIAFVICVTVYTCLLVSRLKSDKLPWVILGNNDLLAYLKVGNYLRFFPGGLAIIDTKDLRLFAANDVFGAFNLISFSSFLLHTGVDNLAMPVLGLGIGAIGVAISRSCRRIFNLGAPLSWLIAVMVITSPMMTYIILNFFLSQIIFIGIFLNVLFLILESSANNFYNRFGSFFLVFSAAIAVMYCYPPWLLQYIVISTSFFALLSAWRPNIPLSAVVIRTVLGGLLFPVLCLAGVCMVCFTRAFLTMHLLAQDSTPNIAGWPLSFVDLQLLLSLPTDWRMTDTNVSVCGESIGVILTLALLFGLLLRFDKMAGAFERRLQVVAFAATVCAYLFVWYWFGKSYQQWKFATTIPLGLGFTVTAASIYLLSLNASYRGRIAIRFGAAIAVIICIGLSIGQFYDRWSRTLVDFPLSLSTAKFIDAMPENRAYVNISDYSSRMAAAVFINFKPTTFSGPTYYGEGSAMPAVSMGPFAEIRAACAPVPSGSHYIAREVWPGNFPQVAPDESLPFSSQAEGCFDLQGFSQPEPWGRWTDGPHASIKFRCGCDLSEHGARIVLKAGAFVKPGLLERQTAHFVVNGGKDQDIIFDSMAYRDLTIDVPKRNGSDDAVDVEIDLPDAIAPRSAGDNRVLGLSVISLKIQTDTAAAVP